MRELDTRIHGQLRARLGSYGLAVGLSGGAFLLTHLSWPLLSRGVFLLFMAAVVLSSWYGGWASGLVSLAASLVAAPFLPARSSQEAGFGAIDAAGLVCFGLVAVLASLATSRRRDLESRMAAQAGEIEELIENPAVGIVAIGPEGTIVRANRSFLGLLGGRAPAAAGRPLAEVVADPSAAERVLRSLREGRAVSGEEVELLGRDGARRPVLLDSGPPHPGSLTLCFLRDLSDLRRSEEARRKVEEAAAAAKEARDHFLAMLSHELRAPLTPVLIAASHEEEDVNLSPETRQLSQLIRRNVELEARIIDNLLDMSMIARDKLELDINTVNTHALLKNVIELCQSEINAKQLELIVDLRANNPYVRGDSARLHQVFWNLIKNAIEFTPPSGRITIRSGDGPDARLAILVADSGAGIEHSRLPSLFNAFEKPAARRSGGLGLGLPISLAVIEAHGGTLRAESAGPGKGSTFTIDLPCLEEHTEEPFSRILARMGEGQQQLRILLVEDHEDSARLIAQLLRKFNYRVTTAATVQGALQAAEAQEFDILVSDIGLPDGNGLDLLGELRKRWPVKGIALTGFGMEADMRMSQEAGFVEHLTKPVNFQRLQMAIQRVAAFPGAVEMPPR